MNKLSHIPTVENYRELSVPQFPHLKKEREVNLTEVKCLEQCLAHTGP